MDKTLICFVFVMFAGCSSPQEGAQTPATETYTHEEATPEPTPEPEAQPEPPKPEPPKANESSNRSSDKIDPVELERARRQTPRFLPSRHK